MAPHTRFLTVPSSSATFAHRCGSPIATAPRPAGPRKTSKSASPISCVTPNTSSTRATASSRRPFATSSAWLARRDQWNDATCRIHKRRLEAELNRVIDLAPVHRAGVKWKATIEKLRPNLLVFMSNRAVPPTNNESERSLRPCATYRKITNGFRSQWGAKQYAEFRAVIETARRHSIGPLQAVRNVLGLPIDTPLPATA